MKKIFFLLVILSAAFFFKLGNSALAATNQVEIYFLPPEAKIQTGGQIVLDLMLSTQKEKIYSLAAQVIYPADKLSFQSLEIQNSIITDWAKKIKESKGVINLTGGVKKGFLGDGKIVQLRFLAKNEGEASVLVPSSSLILNQNQQNVLEKTSPVTIIITSPEALPTSIPSQVEPLKTPRKSQALKFTFAFLLILIISGVLIYLYRERTAYSPPLSP